jgi:KDO2-lipid IV(A) lauroyltransferase
VGRAWQRLRWTAATWIFRLIIQVGRRLPTRLCYAVAAPTADLCYWAFRGQRRNLVANLTYVRAGDAALAKRDAHRVFRNFGKYVIDFFQVPARGPAAVLERLDYDDWDRLDAALAGGKGAVFVTLHLGQWEMGAAALAAHGQRVPVLAEPIAHGPMDDLVQGFRDGLAMEVIAADDRAARRCLTALRNGGALATLIDVVPAGQGVDVFFHGKQTQLSSLPARLALHTGARVIPVIVARSDADPTRFRPLLDLDFQYAPGRGAAAERDLTQAIADSLGHLMRPHLDQWYAFHRVWPADAPVQEGLQPGEASGPRGGEWKYWAIRGTSSLLGWLPLPVGHGLSHLVGDTTFRWRRGMRADVIDNVRHVLGPDASDREVERTAREVVRNVCRYYADLIRLPRNRPEALLRDQVRISGLERVKGPLSEGRGVVIASAHFGNPEIAVQVGPALGLDVLVVSEPLEPPELSELVHRLREANGARYEPVGYRAISAALRHLRKGGVVAIACDRDIQGSGAELAFFGAPTRMPLGAAELALRTGAAVIPGFCRRRIGGFDIVFEEEVVPAHSGDHDADVRATTALLLRRAEAWIRAYPSQWIVLERVWDVRVAPAGSAEWRSPSAGGVGVSPTPPIGPAEQTDRDA